MTLPASFAREGFLAADKLLKTRRIMIGTDGPANSGKTEFAISAPGPGMVICLDRGFDSMLDNPNPPPTRNPDFAFKVVKVPIASSLGSQNEYLDYWRAFYKEYVGATNNLDCRTVVIDGDSDSWELQRLAEFGKLTQIPPILYTQVNAARRAMYARAFDSGKIIIATNKISKDYQPLLDVNGVPLLDNSKKEIREWDGATYKRQGFSDQSYLFSVQLRHLYLPATEKTPQQWGIKIMMCKVDRMLEGLELWGPECNFASLVQVIYPNVPLSEWGFR